MLEIPASIKKMDIVPLGGYKQTVNSQPILLDGEMQEVGTIVFLGFAGARVKEGDPLFYGVMRFERSRGVELPLSDFSFILNLITEEPADVTHSIPE